MAIANNGEEVKPAIDTPTLAVLIRKVDIRLDCKDPEQVKDMLTYGSAVLFGRKKIAVTNIHVQHSINFEGSGVVYSKKGGCSIIRYAEENSKLGLKVLILDSNLNVTPCASEDLGNPIAKPPVKILIQGFGGDGVNPIEKPPLLRQLTAKATHPKDEDNSYEDVYNPEREFIAKELRTELTEDDGSPILPILDAGDSGSPALAVPLTAPAVCYGLLDRMREFGIIKVAIFVRFDKEALAWIKDVAESYGHPIP